MNLKKILFKPIVIFTTVLSFITIVLLIVFLRGNKYQNEYISAAPPPPPSPTETTKKVTDDVTEEVTTLPNHFVLINREQWLAKPPIHELANASLPLQKVIISHTVSKGCSTQNTCSEIVREIQYSHMHGSRFDDIGYNFLIGGDGGVYEGRGWDKTGSHTHGYNIGSLGIAFIGNFEEIAPSPDQLNAAQMLFQGGVDLKNLASGYQLYGQNQFKNTLSPGAELVKIIKTWPHFDASVKYP